jgi:hypothetical protein
MSINKTKILEFILVNNRRPNQKAKDLDEKRLGQALTNYVSPRSDSFDLNFKAKADALCPIRNTVSINKENILESIRVNGRRPSIYSKDLDEKRLGQALKRYTVPSQSSYDPEFKQQIDDLLKEKK